MFVSVHGVGAKTTLTGFETLSGLTLLQRFIKTWRKSQKIGNTPYLFHHCSPGFQHKKQGVGG
ncbi:hypothetical protein KsCSTR_32650 [Candidatus Kuenenia stuttgartiensis]|uniref:Uncharacterized protein n=1 Tax=Kuenenia stuttgartiensis TaxID=174633 RepID=A0A6G7GTG4_KUEST|nr:hypothetical protein KsCSTR_32650 [Candidatus Kuenenia stuttgartiensis]